MNSDASQRLLEAALDDSSVSGFTHQYYRYPARFSPSFVRSVIEEFTKPGDLILDPFMGGATTLVEAGALGRRAIGSDISGLALFLARVKTRILNEQDIEILTTWVRSLADNLNIHKEGRFGKNITTADYYRNVNDRQTWRVRKIVDQYLELTKALPTDKQQEFARCVLLRSAQWALDGRKTVPTIPQFRNTILTYFDEMISGMREFRSIVRSSRKQANRMRKWWIRRWNVSAEMLDKIYHKKETEAPTLILTSPPYPGVHILYHRWQVNGRRETPLPFVIANCEDGAGLSHYTMGSRHEQELRTYFEKQYAAFSALAEIASEKTLLVQMLGFAEPDWQLARYLEVMEKAGFSEVKIGGLSSSNDGRLWRFVPNRKWHADQKGRTGASSEAVLFHRLKNTH